MQPHTISTVSLNMVQTPAQKRAQSGWAGRHGIHWPKGTVLPETQVQACPRVKVADLPEGHLKPRHIEALEQNQKISSCCRHPENHEVEALKSHPDEPLPDVYVFHCTCGRKHRFLCVGVADEGRPMWDAN